jgi:hypothetical protein
MVAIFAAARTLGALQSRERLIEAIDTATTLPIALESLVRPIIGTLSGRATHRPSLLVSF